MSEALSNDSERQLTDDEVVALKEKLRGKYLEAWLGNEGCAQIVVNRLDYRKKDLENGNLTPTQYAFEVATLTADWRLTLDEALSLPGAEWPEGMSPPAIFAVAMEELETSRSNGA
jgi:hypothetical protein